MTSPAVTTGQLRTLRGLYKQGWRDVDIAAELGITRRRVGKLRNALGLPSLHAPGRPPKTERKPS